MWNCGIIGKGRGGRRGREGGEGEGRRERGKEAHAIFKEFVDLKELWNFIFVEL